MTGFLVAKFGGTSVADYNAMNRSADVVLSDPNTRLVVLSASAGVTNLLISLSKGLEATERFVKLNALRKIQLNILEQLQNPNIIRKEVEHLLENIKMLAEIASLATSNELSDEMMSYGELMSSLLFVEILRERNVQAQWFDIRKVMRTSDRFGHAEPDIEMLAELTKEQMSPRLAKGLIITQGFIGSEAEGRTTTLGRGGSDYTAALLGEALNASRINIWTDVPGIYTTDPRVVPNAKRIDVITFEEAAKMATFGAEVLHPSTFLPAIRSDIPFFVGSSKDPKAGGTLVCKKTDNPPLFRALVLRRKQTLVTLNSLGILNLHDFLMKIFDILDQYYILVDLIATSEINISLTLDTTTGNTLLIRSLLIELSKLCQVKVEENLSLVTIVCNKQSYVYSIDKEVFNVLDSFSIRMICYGISSYNLCFLVPADQAEQVVLKLHQHLFE